MSDEFPQPGRWIGDTDLVGGIDRIKITACEVHTETRRDCSAPVNYFK